MKIEKVREFNSIVGNNLTVGLIRKLLKQNSYPNFSIYTGKSGCGKSTLAEITAMCLLCENKDWGQGLVDVNPCGECETCKKNLQALESNRSNDFVSKLNMALLDKKELASKIKGMFGLQPRLGSCCVYILEEFDSLTKEEQVMFLEEISNMSDDVYIMLCTSRPYKLIPDIKGRGFEFKVEVPNTEMCLELVESICDRYGNKRLKKDSAKFLIRHLGNIPRELVKVTSTLIQGDAFDDDKIKEYLGFMETNAYVDFYKKCKEDLFQFIAYIEELKTKDVYKFYKGLKSFMIDLTIHLYGREGLYFTKAQKEILRDSFSNLTSEDYDNLLKYIQDSVCNDEEDIMFTLIGIRRYITKSSKEKEIKESVKTAKVEVIESQRKFVTKEQKSEEVDTALTSDKILGILNGMKTVNLNQGEKND